MSLNINNESTNIRRTQQKRYGSLLVDTTIKGDKGSIDLTMPINKIQNNQGNNRGQSPINGIQNNQENNRGQSLTNGPSRTTKADKIVEPSPNIAAIKPSKDVNIKNSINTNLTAKLMRGQKISINSKTQNLSKLLIALDWDIKNIGNTEFELDTSLFLVDKNNNTSEENFVFYGNPRSKDGGVIIDKDHNSGLKKAYDQAIQLDLSLIPNSIQKLAVTVTVYEGDKRRQNFGQVTNGYFRILDAQSRSELFKYNFNEGLKFETAVVVVEIYRYKDEWKINPIGNGFIGGLKALCDNYGVEAE